VLLAEVHSSCVFSLVRVTIIRVLADTHAAGVLCRGLNRVLGKRAHEIETRDVRPMRAESECIANGTREENGVGSDNTTLGCRKQV